MPFSHEFPVNENEQENARELANQREGFSKRTVTRKQVAETLISVAVSACINEHRRPPTSARRLPEK